MESELTENQQKFKELYEQEIIISEGAMSEELLALFDAVLLDLGSSPELMDTFIQSIIDENMEHVPSELEKLQLENEELKSRIDMNESTILELSDMMLGGM